MTGHENMKNDKFVAIGDLRERDGVQGRFLVTEKQLAYTKEGKAFLKLGLMNRAGLIEGILWENAEAEYARFAQGEIIEVHGTVVLYQQERKIKLQKLVSVSPEEIRKEDFLPSSARDPGEMEEELHRTIRKVRNPYLRRLLESVFRDPEIWRAYRLAPAAKSIHHAYLGGLIEHTLSLTRLVRLATQNYPFLDGDLVLAGALLHDMGKAWELSSELGFDYTDEGRLLGHILIGIEVLDRKIKEIPDFPPPLTMQIKHLVASHHGELAFGSPKQPQTLEALCLHALDNLDAKLWGVLAFMQKETRGNDRWTSYHRVHERYFYVPESLGESKSKGKSAQEESPEGSPDLFDL